MKCRKFFSGDDIIKLIDEDCERRLANGENIDNKLGRGKRRFGLPICPECGGLIKPDVVLYEEGLDQRVIEGAVKAIKAADTLIIGGTSLTVYPAAGLIDYVHGENLILLNKSSTPQDHMASLVIHEPIGEVLSQIKVN